MSGAAFALTFGVCIVHVRVHYRVVSVLKSPFVVTYDCISSVFETQYAQASDHISARALLSRHPMLSYGCGPPGADEDVVDLARWFVVLVVPEVCVSVFAERLQIRANNRSRRV